MSTIHYIIADLECPECGMPAGEVQIDTPLGPITHPTYIRVGDWGEGLDWSHVLLGYPILREPAADDPIRVIETWWCNSCGDRRWAMITFADNILLDVRAVKLDQPTVRIAHAITDEVGEVYFERTGEWLGDLGPARTGFRERLLAVLPPGPEEPPPSE